jgi:hypothetical protein
MSFRGGNKAHEAIPVAHEKPRISAIQTLVILDRAPAPELSRIYFDVTPVVLVTD